MTTNGYEISFGGDENVLEIEYDDSCKTVNILKTIELYTFKGSTVT